MFMKKYFLPTINPSKFLFHRRTHSSVRAPFTNKVTHYLRRAQLIDSIRLALRSDSPESLSSLLKNRLVDSFVVSNALRSAPNADSALSVIQTLKENPNFSHTQNTVLSLATVLSKSHRIGELKALIGEVDSGTYKNVRVSFMNLMQWYSTIGDLDLVITTWNDYREKSVKRVCTESYNIVMSVYVKNGKNSESVETFRKMIDEGAIPNSRTYTVMIEHLVNSGKLDSAMEVFVTLPSMRVKRTLKQYSILVEGFAGVDRFDEVKTLINEMNNDWKFPGRDMRGSLQLMHEAGYVEETDEILRELFPNASIKDVEYFEDSSDEDEDEDGNFNGNVNVDGVKLKPWLDPRALAHALNEWSPEVVSALEEAKFVWTTRLVTKVIRNFNSTETAWSFFCWVAYQPGYTHDVYTVERMMSILARHGHAELVDQLILKIRKEGMRLPFSTIRLIIDFYGISKKADAALKIFYNDRTLCSPISRYNLMLLYSSLLRTLTKCKRDSDAVNLLEEMILGGVCPDTQTFSGLMYHFALQGDIKTVQKLFTMVRQSGVEPDAYMFKILIQAYCKCERAALAFRVFEDMNISNLMPDLPTKELLVRSLWKEGRRKEAALVEEKCEEMNDVLSLTLRGHVWTISSTDLTKVYDIYSNSFPANSG